MTLEDKCFAFDWRSGMIKYLHPFGCVAKFVKSQLQSKDQKSREKMTGSKRNVNNCKNRQKYTISLTQVYRSSSRNHDCRYHTSKLLGTHSNPTLNMLGSHQKLTSMSPCLCSVPFRAPRLVAFHHLVQGSCLVSVEEALANNVAFHSSIDSWVLGGA